HDALPIWAHAARATYGARFRASTAKYARPHAFGRHGAGGVGIMCCRTDRRQSRRNLGAHRHDFTLALALAGARSRIDLPGTHAGMGHGLASLFVGTGA